MEATKNMLQSCYLYQQDGNGTIKGCELRGFLKDMKATQDDVSNFFYYYRWCFLMILGDDFMWTSICVI